VRYCVKYSRRTATWFHAAIVEFLEAPDRAGARAAIEARSTPAAALEVWDVREATPALEARAADHAARVARWTELATAAAAPRGLL
jgi:hypothetical protein